MTFSFDEYNDFGADRIEKKEEMMASDFENHQRAIEVLELETKQNMILKEI